ncbi:MAG TPA: AAA family ATPase, partial [Planctomycetota bacterium]|nr:AAA family ATPase [Planctomycetota bacterium]
MSEPAMDRLRAAHGRMKEELHRAIVGQEEVIDQLLIGILTRGHCLLVGVPGLAKTLLISSLSKTLDLSFNRIQFTPDLMPGDITGTDLLHVDAATNERTFRFAPGPLFANVVLADEINRTPPKTQAALLESMVEGQVTVGGRRHPLPNPFFVLATQNPIEQEGTFPLPEAQLDRFLMTIRQHYPNAAEEEEIV